MRTAGRGPKGGGPKVTRRTYTPREGEPDYATLRRRWLDSIAQVVRPLRHRFPVGERLWFSFEWCEPDKRRDKDNVRAGGTKLILDACKAAGAMPDDDNRYVGGFRGDAYDYDSAAARAGGGVVVNVFGADSGHAISFFVPHRLPDENEMLRARELGARRSVRREGRA
jgi:hypothetical protein